MSTLCDLLKQINAYRSMKASVGVTNKLCLTTESNTLTQHMLKAGQNNSLWFVNKFREKP